MTGDASAPKAARRRRYLVYYQDRGGKVRRETVEAASRGQADALVRSRNVVYVYGATLPGYMRNVVVLDGAPP